MKKAKVHVGDQGVFVNSDFQDQNNYYNTIDDAIHQLQVYGVPYEVWFNGEKQWEYTEEMIDEDIKDFVDKIEGTNGLTGEFHD